MLITNTLIFVHMPKTGGIWVADVMRKLVGASMVPRTQRHTTVNDIPEDLRKSRTVFGTIRDPWSWYVSLWQHLQNGVDGPPILRAIGEGNEGFPAFIKGMTDPRIWGSVPEEIRGGWPWPPPRNCGFYTALVEKMYGEPIALDVLISTASLHKGLSSLLGVQIGHVRFPPKNTSRDRPATHVACPGALYGNRERSLVDEADGTTAWVFGYEHPFRDLPEPILEIRKKSSGRSYRSSPVK